MSESKSKLEKKQEELDGLELDADIQDLEDKIRRRKSGVEVKPTLQKSTLGERLVEEVVLPIVRRNLEPDKSNSATQEALKIANKALDRAGRGAPPSSGNMISDIVNALGSFKELIKDDSVKAQLDKVTQQLKELELKKPEPSKELGKEFGDFLDLYDKIQERMGPTGGGTSDGYYDFEKWKIDQSMRQTQQNRSFNLRIRQQDKAHDIELAKLGIEKERNELLMSGLQTIGKAIGEELLDDEDYDEPDTPDPAKGRSQLIKMPCTECGAEILIPPEAQVAGKEIKCSKCESVFEWE